MSTLFQGLFGPTPQDVLAEQQDMLNTQLAGMQNPYERLGLLLGTAFMGDPKKSAQYKAAQAQQEQMNAVGSDPQSRAQYLREAIASGKIPADQLVNAQKAIQALDPQVAVDPLTPKELADMYGAYTDESVKAFLASGDTSALVPQGRNTAARSVIKDDADWKAFEGAELALGEGFYDDLLGFYGERRASDVGEDNRLEPAKSAVYNLANQIRFNSEQPMTLERSLKMAKEQMIKEMDNDGFSFVKGTRSGGVVPNTTADVDGTIPMGDPELDYALDSNGMPLAVQQSAPLVGEDITESEDSLRLAEQNLVARMEADTTKSGRAALARRLGEVRRKLKKYKGKPANKRTVESRRKARRQNRR